MKDLELLDVSQTQIGGRPMVTVTVRAPLELLPNLLDWDHEHPNLPQALVDAGELRKALDTAAARAAIARAPHTTLVSADHPQIEGEGHAEPAQVPAAEPKPDAQPG